MDRIHLPSDFLVNHIRKSKSREIQDKIDSKTKPPGSLGLLETIAKQICLVQDTLEPSLNSPDLFLFAGDHGISSEKVSAYPKEVTWQMVFNFLTGGACSSVFARQLGFQFKVVDVGVDYDFSQDLKRQSFAQGTLLSQKVAFGTKNFLVEPAMDLKELEKSLLVGFYAIRNHSSLGSNVAVLGEMGIGNTSSAALVYHCLLHLPLEDLVGKGTGLDDQGVQHKLRVLQQAVKRGGTPSNPVDILLQYGGLEIAAMVGAYLALGEKRSLILVDGWIATSAFLLACEMEPNLWDYAIFCHESEERGHKLILEKKGIRPILQWNMRLGEGSGALAAYPTLQLAVAFLNQMSSFEEAKVSSKASP